MRELLKKHFGYDTFRPMQKEIVDTVVAGNDALVLMPTGGGKSLCFQLPALALPGITIVVSPLIALMKDQVDALAANRIPAASINSSLSYKEQQDVMQRARDGKIKLLYVAPERVNSSGFYDFLESLNVSLIAIDEAHCISEWGHDFRPDYRNLKVLRRRFSDVPLIALTATATQEVKKDILNQLNINEAAIFASSFNRPNLYYRVEPKMDSYARLLELLDSRRDQSIIIYCFSRKNTEELASNLERAGFPSLPYHAGLSDHVRAETQEKFITGRVPIIVATIAFGMGIDKSDVRLVVHMDLPKTLEGYYQETGRAGRDGQPSECVLFYSYADKRKQDYFIDQIEYEKERELARMKLELMIAYAQRNICRRTYLLAYFGEDSADSCGACDICDQQHVERVDATEISQKILSTVLRTGERFGAAHISDVLRGSKKKRILELRHDQLSVHGIAKDVSDAAMRQYLNELEATGYIERNEGEYPTLRVSGKGKQALMGSEAIFLRKISEPASSKTTKHKSPKQSGKTIFETKALLEQGFSLEEIVKQRELAASTIMSHIEQLKERKETLNIHHLKPNEDVLQPILDAFKTSKTTFLSPVFKKLGGKYSYDQLRLARLFIDQ